MVNIGYIGGSLMKKTLRIIMVIILCVSFAASDTVSINWTNNSKSAFTILNIKNVYAKTSSKTLGDLVKYLKAKKLLSGKETKMDATLIGGKSGIKYSDVGVELYEYNTNTKAYKSVLKTKMVVLKDFNMELKVDGVKGKFVLICDKTKNRSKVIKAFNAFK
jgi:hypothetical protein